MLKTTPLIALIAAFAMSCWAYAVADEPHHHGAIDASGETPPRVSLSITPDAMAGYNLKIDVENFQFAPENASRAHVAGEGHGHLYIDGKKITRLYAPWHYIGTLAPGRHEVRVTLNANDHRDYLVDGQTVSATEIVIVTPE